MNKICFLACLMALLSLSSATRAYELHLVIHENDSVDLLDFKILDAEISAFPSAGEDNYAFVIVSGDGKALFNKSFQMDFIAYRFKGPNATSSDVVPLSQVEDYWRLPYFEEAAAIQLFHEDKKIFEYRLKPEEKGPEEKPQEKPAPICGTSVAFVLLVGGWALFLKFRNKNGGAG